MVLNLFQKSLSAILKLRNDELSLFIRHKHWNPKYKKERKEKVIKVDFSDLINDANELSKDAKRTKLKEKGIFPQKPWFEKPMYISCTSNVFEPYIPPEGDGKFSAISTSGLKQNMTFFGKKKQHLIKL